MRFLLVNASPPVSVTPLQTAELHYIYISAGHDYYGRQGEGRLQHGITSVREVECVAGKGLRGDRYFDQRPDATGQVTFLEFGVVEEIRRAFHLPKLPASVFRRNLIVGGVTLADWKHRRFRFQDLEFEGAQECKPCVWMDRAIAPGVQKFMRSHFRGGLRTKVVTGGTLRVNVVPR